VRPAVTRRRGLAAAVVLGGLAIAVLVWRTAGRGLPRDLTIAELVEDLTDGLDHATIEASKPGAVHVGTIQTNPYFDGGFRRSIIAPPPATIRLRVHVPEGGALHFGAGVASQGRRDEGAAGVRFAVDVDGHERWSRVVNPAGTRHDRRWFDERIDLRDVAGRDVELALRTTPGGTGTVTGTPGWSTVRILRERAIARQPARPDAPNVLVLLIDTLRADRLGVYGASPSPSPNLDRLARDGLVFDQAIAQSSWTMPSVASIFTGLHPRSHGVVGGDCLWETTRRTEQDDEPACAYLADGLPTLAQQAEEAGITTFGVSANPLVSRATNYARGFETFVEFQPDTQWRELRPASEVNRAFLDWLRPNRGYRFLAYLQYVDPHHPYTPPPPFAPPVPGGLREAVARGRIDAIAHKVNREGTDLLTDAEVAWLRTLYDAEIRYWDSELEKLRAGLAELGVADNTVIVVTADHGEEFQDHGALLHGTHLYDEQVHVPLMIIGPTIAPGRVRTLAQHIDLLPTIVGMLGASAPPGLPGRDLRAPSESRVVFSETRHGVGANGSQIELVAARTDAWKLIGMPGQGRFELYDLLHDPGEHHDRFGDASEGPALARTLADWEATAPPPPVVARAGDGGLHERLRALGYVQ